MMKPSEEGYPLDSKQGMNKAKSRVERKNKVLVTNLKHKMFKGFLQISNKKNFKPVTMSNAIPTMQWEKPEPRPFDELYNLNYKHKHSSFNQVPHLEHLVNINHINPAHSSLSKTRNVFLTNDANHPSSLLPSINKSLTLAMDDSNELLLKRLFPYESELNKISSLRFLSLEKKPYDYSMKPKLSKAEQRQKVIYDETEFLYRISHPLKSPVTQSNFNSKQLTRTALSQSNKKDIDTASVKDSKEKLELNITGMLSRKRKLLSLEERRMNYIHCNLDAIRSLPRNIFEEYANNLFKDNGDDNKQSNVKEIQFDPEEEARKERRRLRYIRKQPQMIKYQVFQSTLSQRCEKYNELRKMAFEVKGSMLAEDNDKHLKLRTTFINPDSHLLTDPKYTYKTYYEKQEKKRDSKIAWGLRKEFNSNDIRRILNGKELRDPNLA